MSAPFMFFPDSSFHFETLRQIANATDHGADINEVLQILPTITSGDFESFSAAFDTLARRVEAYALTIRPTTPSTIISARDALFRASTYYKAADFFLHGNPHDPRITELWARQTACFDAAIALLDAPGRRVRLPTEHGFTVEAIFYPTTRGTGPRPTLLIGSGFDGSQEEMLHEAGFAALRRGFNVITYEGPGQPTVRRTQGLGFVVEWERVVSPVVDYLCEHAAELNVDPGKIGLWGHSMGGFLGLRAVAFEPRIAAFVACDGVWDVDGIVDAAFKEMVRGGRYEEAEALVRDPKTPAGVRWAVLHGLWVMFDHDRTMDEEGRYRFREFLDRFAEFRVREEWIDQVQCKVLVLDAAEDIFFEGQPKKVAERLGEDKATYHLFTTESGAGAHCQIGAANMLAQVSLDWFESVVGA